MRVNEFLYQVAEMTRQDLPPRWRGFRTRTRFTLIQLYYGKRTIHYEVWVRGSPHHLVEIGLHLESDGATNRAILAFLGRHELELRAELGERIELEQWTKTWARAHQLLPYEKLDAALVKETAAHLAPMIRFLQPLLESLEGQ